MPVKPTPDAMVGFGMKSGNHFHTATGGEPIDLMVPREPTFRRRMIQVENFTLTLENGDIMHWPRAMLHIGGLEEREPGTIAFKSATWTEPRFPS